MCCASVVCVRVGVSVVAHVCGLDIQGVEQFI